VVAGKKVLPINVKGVEVELFPEAVQPEPKTTSKSRAFLFVVYSEVGK
jgi:hypothetical protein